MVLVVVECLFDEDVLLDVCDLCGFGLLYLVVLYGLLLFV